MLKHLILAGLALAAASTGTIAATADSRADPWSDAKALSSGGNAFAFDLYRELSGSPGNLFFSPYSVRIALALAYAGARGETARQMRQTLHLDADDETLHRTLGALIQAIETSADEGYVLTTASGLWIEERMEVLPSFIDRTTQVYAGSVQRVDFLSGAGSAARRINAWIGEHTHGLIPHVLGENALDASTRFVLVNAVHFRAIWETPFEPHRTRPVLFTRSNGSTVTVPFMQSGAPWRARLHEDRELQALWLDYKGDTVSLVLFLPRADVALHAIENAVDAAWIADLEKKSRMREVIVGMPRFRIETEALPLTSALHSLGMTDAFLRERADFSAISSEEALRLADVRHKALLEIDEQGTEAAAVTVVGGAVPTSTKPERPPVALFFADRPFLFLIQERHTGLILFAGRLEDPR